MATRAWTAETEYYASKATYGNLAYETGGYAQPETFEHGTVITEPRRQSQVELRNAAATRINPLRAALFVLGFALAAALMVLLLMEHVKLTAVADMESSLNSELAQLREEETRLLIDYESTFNLTEIEEYARTQLGMVSASNSQRHYLNTGAEDKAVVLKQPEGDEGFLGGAKEFFSSILE